MMAENSADTLDIITSAIDKHSSTKNFEAAGQLIKNTMDRKFGATWHVAIGEGFGFDLTYQEGNMLYAYYNNIGVVVFKC